MFSIKEIWIETTYDKDKHVLQSMEFTENITEGRLMNGLICNNWKFIKADVNTVVLERVDKNHTAIWMVLSRKEPILWPHLTRVLNETIGDL